MILFISESRRMESHNYAFLAGITIDLQCPHRQNWKTVTVTVSESDSDGDSE